MINPRAWEAQLNTAREKIQTPGWWDLLPNTTRLRGRTRLGQEEFSYGLNTGEEQPARRFCGRIRKDFPFFPKESRTW